MRRLTIYKLIQKYRENTATDSERAALTDWYVHIANQQADFPEEEEEVGKEMLLRLNAEISLRKRKLQPTKYWVAAASVLIAFFISLTVWLNQTGFKVPKKESITRSIVPGGNNAVLILSDGRKISLSDARIGELAHEQSLKIKKDKNGQLIYDLAEGKVNLSSGTGSNTIETPKGGQYQVNLPDGTHVWLNAASSISFPLNFTHNRERKIFLKGEAYFEVAHNKLLPFRVVTQSQTLEVLGTHFNISAYSDDYTIKTTLIEGKVKLVSGKESALLKPGQQSDFSNHFIVHDAEIQEAIAWKNGEFRFDDEKLESVMRKVSRWYNVETVFEDPTLKEETFAAVTTRFADISTLLNLMEQTGSAYFKIEGQTIYISRKKTN